MAVIYLGKTADNCGVVASPNYLTKKDLSGIFANDSGIPTEVAPPL
jgi:hypothetical protein